jgi:ATP-binding cassette subfamily B protein
MLDEGRIVEQGTHAELYEKQGAYYELYEKQLNAEEA